MITAEIIQNTRSLNLHYGRLLAIKWLRQETGVGYLQACVAFEDIITNQRWTKPELQADRDRCTFPRGTSVLTAIGVSPSF